MDSNYQQGWLDPRLDPRGYLPELISRLRERGQIGLDLSPGDPLCGAAADALEKITGRCPWVWGCAPLGCDKVESIGADVLNEFFARVMPGHFEPIEDEL